MIPEGTLTRESWIQAALKALGRAGPSGVRVDRLAREMEISRGSFYWHFRDRADLLEAVLSAWEEETLQLIEASKEAEGPEARLLRLIELVKGLGGRLPDAAVFLWARQDDEVARRVSAVEARRVEYIVELLIEAGVPEVEAKRRAEIGYLIVVGLMERSFRDHRWKDEVGRILDDVGRMLLGLGEPEAAPREEGDRSRPGRKP